MRRGWRTTRRRGGRTSHTAQALLCSTHAHARTVSLSFLRTNSSQPPRHVSPPNRPSFDARAATARRRTSARASRRATCCSSTAAAWATATRRASAAACGSGCAHRPACGTAPASARARCRNLLTRPAANPLSSLSESTHCNIKNQNSKTDRQPLARARLAAALQHQRRRLRRGPGGLQRAARAQRLLPRRGRRRLVGAL